MATSAAQTAANQANAQCSTGPRTVEGKAASSVNALRHGFRSKSVLLPGDDPAEYQLLLDALTTHFLPEDLSEDRFVREMADAEWRLRRVRDYLSLTLAKVISRLRPLHEAATEIELQALAWIEGKPELGSLTRYEQKYERQYERAYRLWVAYQEVKHSRDFDEARELMQQAHQEMKPDSIAEAPAEAQRRNGTNEPNSGLVTPRNAPCPCGSKLKFKRCCGANAPPALHHHAKAA